MLYALDGLSRFVVVHEDDLDIRFVEQVALAYRADDLVVVVYDGEAAGGALGEQGADALHGVACEDRLAHLVCHCADRRGVFDEHGGRCGAVMAGDNRDPVCPCQLAQFPADDVVLGDDERLDAGFDAQALDVFPVSRDDDDVFALVFFEQFPEGSAVVVADHDRTVKVVVRVKFDDGRCVERLFDQVQACQEDVALLGGQQLV